MTKLRIHKIFTSGLARVVGEWFVKRSPATLKKEVLINKHYIGYFDTPKKTNHAVLKRLKALAL